MNCPKCQSRIPNENINIVTDVAQCEECRFLFKISENLSSSKSSGYTEEVDSNFNINKPPNGAWIREESDALVIGATTRSAMAFFLVPFMIIWSGGSLGGIYGGQIATGEFNLLFSLFGIPFILGSILFWGLAFMFIIGKVEVTVDHTEGRVFTGIGKIGLTKRFELHEVTSAREETVVGNKGNRSQKILLEGQKRISFGTFLNDSRRYYILKSIQKILSDKKSNRNFLKVNLFNHLVD